MTKNLYLILDADNDYEDMFLIAKNALMGGMDKIILQNPKNYNQNELARFIELTHNYQSELIFLDNLDYAITNDSDGVLLTESITTERNYSYPENFSIGILNNTENISTDYIEKFNTDFLYIKTVASDSVRNELEKISSFNLPVYVSFSDAQVDLSSLLDLPIDGFILNYEDITHTNITEYTKTLKDKLD